MRRIERYFSLSLDLFFRDRILVKQPLDGLAVDHRLGDDLRYIFRFEMAVESVTRFDHGQWPLLAEAVAAGYSQGDLVGEALTVEFFYEGSLDGLASGGLASGSPADDNGRLFLGATRGKLFTKSSQFNG